MKLKSYFNPTRDANLKQIVQVRLAADAAPAAPFVLLGDLTHEPLTDNLPGAQKKDVSHAIYQHVQEQLYRLHDIQDMQKISLTYGGGFKLLQRVVVDQGINRLGVNQEATLKVSLVPADATNDGITFSVSNPDLVTITGNTGNGTFKFMGKQKGEVFVRVRVNDFEQNIPFEFTEEMPAVVLITGLTIAPATVALTTAAPTSQLTVNITPASASIKGLTFSSSDPTKATVSATGLVTRVANGSTTITATAKDGSGKTATRAVTVTT